MTENEDIIDHPWHMTKKKRLDTDIEEIRREASDPDLMDALISLVRNGTIVNSGRRHNGRIVWMHRMYADPGKCHRSNCSRSSESCWQQLENLQ